MKSGSLTENYLKNSVFRFIKKLNNGIGPGIGNDYSIIENDNIICTDGFGESPSIAWNKAMNNFLCSCGTPKYARIALLLSNNVKDSNIKAYMRQFEECAQYNNVQIIGGDSKVSPDFKHSNFYVTIIGNNNPVYNPNIKLIEPGDSIVLTNYVGLLGSKLLTQHNIDALSKCFSNQFMQSFDNIDDKISVRPAINALLSQISDFSSNIEYIHDISDGGIYKALWELGEHIKRGIFIDNKRICIKQESIEISEFFDINPYFLDGTGCLLIVCKNGRELVELLNKKQIVAQIIGVVTDQKEKKIKITEDDIRTLSSIPEI